jgi:hypothetical protein
VFHILKHPHLSILLKLGGIVALAAIVLSSSAGRSLAQYFDMRYLLAVAVVQPLVLGALVLQGVRHAVLIDRPGLPYFSAIKAVVLSQGLNLLLPARLSEVLKATYLRNRANVPMSTGVSAVLLERTVDLIIVALLGALCLFLYVAMVNKTSVLVFAGLVAIIIGVALWGGEGILALARALPWPRLGGLIERAYLHFGSTLKDRAFIHGLGLGVVVWGISFLNVYLLLDFAGGTNVGVYGALLVFVCTTVGAAVPALPGGLGTYEAAAVFALTSLGYTFVDALTLAVTIHVAQLVLPLAMALVILLTERIGLSALIADLRSSAQQP